MTKHPAHIVVAGGGYVGLYSARRLQRRLRRELRGGDIRITVVSPDPYMTYQPFLPEAAAGSLSPRHVVVPLRRVLPDCRFLAGAVVGADPERRFVTVRTAANADAAGEPLRLDYDELVLAPGSISRTLPVPGLADNGVGFQSLEEAIGLRNHVLEQLDIASSTRDSAVRDAALTFVFVGGGYAGVEALAELEDMARYACRYYPNIRPDEPRWVLVEASDRILSEVGPEMGAHALRELRGRNIDVRLNTRLVTCEGRVAVLDDGSRLPARTLVWTTGVRPHPVLAECGVPLHRDGRVRCAADLRVVGVPHVWSAGDAAAVPDLAAPSSAPAEPVTEPATEPGEPGTGPPPHRRAPKNASPHSDAPRARIDGAGAHTPLCAPNAQHAVRQAERLADNLVASLRGEPTTDYRHRTVGSVASLGLHRGVARVYGRKLRGLPAWLVHRCYHLSRMPTGNRKARVLAEWALAGLFKREIVSLGSLEHPRAEFERAADPDRRRKPS
ncbi:FAD-dependent oxidoreductase [Streptomyces sp. DSM 44915]|uniref:FAD-dependent oxidoreductase n=1 Tax=Streptomyces chisholmiae TaxID=3075540 RepID=A0ABU2K1L9_9ACTN|nr:FAD-dependent oxidoreductase [Streptomyces sp. DSM 44915]MDT0270338.1 FAD-dependent oxidoreductase [Streptomyces sp. DSM 44915]